jgi:hypothetical protein
LVGPHVPPNESCKGVGHNHGNQYIEWLQNLGARNESNQGEASDTEHANKTEIITHIGRGLNLVFFSEASIVSVVEDHLGRSRVGFELCDYVPAISWDNVHIISEVVEEYRDDRQTEPSGHHAVPVSA